MDLSLRSVNIAMKPRLLTAIFHSVKQSRVRASSPREQGTEVIKEMAKGLTCHLPIGITDEKQLNALRCE